MPAPLDAINAALDDFAAAWRTNDGSALGALFTEDATLVNPFGDRADGRDAVAAMYSEYFGGMLAGTATTIDVTSVRHVGDDVAFLDGEQAILAPDGSVVLSVHLAALLQRDGDGWRFVDARPYTYAAAPA
jgi:uncharacterized protein (TIGR02246 family)